MYSVITTAINQGMDAIPVHVEADISDGLPTFEMVGFLSSEVKEARERVRTALRNSGFHIPAKHITVNLTPADIRKSGNACDLPVALAILSALGFICDTELKNYIVMGEVGLNGRILPVRGVLSVAVMAKKAGYDGIIVPVENQKEASILPDLNVIPVHTLKQLVDWCETDRITEKSVNISKQEWTEKYDVDFSDVYGQDLVKRACEIAVSGMHNLLLIGPPGSGKTMIAQRIVTILPELERDEKLELSQIYSLCGKLDENRIIRNERPFRSPHHTITPQALVGGGNVPMPGEISLAHRGVLYLDELPEFRKETIEALREPMEEKRIHISRVSGTIVYPSDFMLVASMNPCPCGFYPDMNQCICTPQEIRLYMNRISKAMLNRIDMSVETQPLRYTDMMNQRVSESSARIRARVLQAREIQKSRFAGTDCQFNSQMTNEMIRKYCALDSSTRDMLEQLYGEYELSARTYMKVLKTARTIADLDHSEQISSAHIQEAVCYRSLDRKYWRRF